MSKMSKMSKQDKYIIGSKWKVLENIYPVDIDSMVSKDVSEDTFTGMLTGLYTEKDLEQVKRNIDEILNQKENILLKDSIIDIKYIEFDNDNISYIEVYVINDGNINKDFLAFDGIREEFLTEVIKKDQE